MENFKEEVEFKITRLGEEVKIVKGFGDNKFVLMSVFKSIYPEDEGYKIEFC